MTNQIRQLLARSPALARVREGLVRVLSGVEGVTATEGERDSLGRPATRYDQPSIDGTVLSLLVDAGTAAGPQHSALPGDVAVLDDGVATLVAAPAPTVSAAMVLSRSSHARWLILGMPRTARGSRGAT